ncbi:branched-chain amino acid ABC transporter permease [Variovorax sp. NFACC27]|uniref:branched-chain amino acid ABC transporter permease n=1 Tax=unclassified Variovorax TaxID=663243 RepID=UPI00089CB1FC|nr:branched-chain amino acid transport system permease protein [Variovorax sp. NFACC28]SEG98162.1 branched-chain amino acid transport system permease protein [Variovorax sp. NFACC29]SFE05121.1 branched-chain amino acid transport system permease protein [Variovorax sp. NFACC26]SFH13080.1 branched-chain amino acid transport system permease protein [Variovorax sp. NFACC27]
MRLIDALIFGLTLGGTYALVALGLNLQYGVARILNLAYGEMLIAAALGALVLFTRSGVSPLVSLIVLVPLAACAGALLYRIAFLPLVRRARSRDALEGDSILSTFGLLFVVQGVMLAMFGGNYMSYSYLSVPVEVLGTTIAANRLLALVVALVLGASLFLLLTRTRMGTALRAVAVDPASAPLVAIDVTKIAMFAFAIGTALVAVAGVLVSMFSTFSATMGVLFTMKALIVVIMGGVGNFVGCVLAALLLGLSESFVATYVDPGLTLAANYAIFLLVLVFRPSGLFGRTGR